MVQQIIVFSLIAACGGWVLWQGFRFIKPKPGGKACGGNCCDTAAPARPASSGGQTVMISSDDMRLRLKARKG